MATDLAARVKRFVRRERLFEAGDRLLVACSGGLDSTVLAHVLHALGYPLTLAHMNYGLRGTASDGDQGFVEDLARTLGAGVRTKAGHVGESATPGESTQMTARRLRYAWLAEVANGEGFTRILTAHHLDDNLETLLINLGRGGGVNGLSGMAPRRGLLARPLLEVSRADLASYASERGLRWREDASNATDVYLRNRIRHHLAPTLRQVLRLNDATLTRALRNLRGDAYFSSAGVDHAIHENRRVRGDTVELLAEAQWSFATRRAFLHRAAAAHYGLSADQVDQLAELPPGRGVVTERYTVDVTEFGWRVRPRAAGGALPALTVGTLPHTVVGGALQFHLALTARPASLSAERTLYLAPPDLPLHLRPRQNGDRIAPLGLGGKTQKLKQFFSDHKVPRDERDRTYLVTDGRGTILAVAGHCVTHHGRVRDTDERVLRLSWAQPSHSR